MSKSLAVAGTYALSLFFVSKCFLYATKRNRTRPPNDIGIGVMTLEPLVRWPGIRVNFPVMAISRFFTWRNSILPRPHEVPTEMQIVSCIDHNVSGGEGRLSSTRCLLTQFNSTQTRRSICRYYIQYGINYAKRGNSARVSD